MGKKLLEDDSPKTHRSALIKRAVDRALSKEGRHWDLIYSGIEGVRPETEVPSRSWEQAPKLSVAFGERLFSRKSILEHEKPSWLAMQIATDLIWISGFTLIGSRIEQDSGQIAPFLRRSLERLRTDTDGFDATVLESHNRWCYCAREIDSEDDPEPFYFAVALESSLEIAALVLDLGLEHDLFTESVQPDSAD